MAVTKPLKKFAFSNSYDEEYEKAILSRGNSYQEAAALRQFEKLLKKVEAETN